MQWSDRGVTSTAGVTQTCTLSDARLSWGTHSRPCMHATAGVNVWRGRAGSEHTPCTCMPESSTPRTWGWSL